MVSYFVHYKSTQLTDCKGTLQDAWMQLEFYIPRFTEGGEWKVEFITLRDVKPNWRNYTFEQLGAAGFQNTFTGKRIDAP
jgi:hypothetical protein